MMLSIAPTRQRTTAAARVTSLYAASVALLLAPVTAALHGLADALAFLASPLGAWLAVMFLLLVIARRTAFVALWLLTLVAWVWQWDTLGPNGILPGAGFALWSMLAAPLYLITAVGFGTTRPTTPARRVAWALGGAAWAGLATMGVAYEYGFQFTIGCFGGYATTGARAVDMVVQKGWMLLPPLVALDAMRRVWRAPQVVEPRFDDPA